MVNLFKNKLGITKRILTVRQIAHMKLTYLLTYSMQQSTSWEANWFAASQEIPRVLWNPKVPHRTHKRPPRIGLMTPLLTRTYSMDKSPS
jgi:hypothetical protein